MHLWCHKVMNEPKKAVPKPVPVTFFSLSLSPNLPALACMGDSNSSFISSPVVSQHLGPFRWSYLPITALQTFLHSKQTPNWSPWDHLFTSRHASTSCSTTTINSSYVILSNWPLYRKYIFSKNGWPLVTVRGNNISIESILIKIGNMINK